MFCVKHLHILFWNGQIWRLILFKLWLDPSQVWIQSVQFGYILRKRSLPNMSNGHQSPSSSYLKLLVIKLQTSLPSAKGRISKPHTAAPLQPWFSKCCFDVQDQDHVTDSRQVSRLALVLASFSTGFCRCVLRAYDIASELTHVTTIVTP